MTSLRFLWDERKNSVNRKRNGVSFEEAQSVFYDENAKHYFDPDHSQDEDRFIMLGISSRLRILVVCHCHREGGAAIRIFSTRKATRAEQKAYEG